MSCCPRTWLGPLLFVATGLLWFGLLPSRVCSEQKASPTIALRAGGPEEPVRYTGKAEVLPYHDGGLRPAIGVKSFQAFRANRAHLDLAEDYGWTYNHAPMLAYWNGRFYLEYLSGPIHENHSPMQTLLLSSPDGVNWEKPFVFGFPIPPHHPFSDSNCKSS
jgi:hypothetical protein